MGQAIFGSGRRSLQLLNALLEKAERTERELRDVEQHAPHGRGRSIPILAYDRCRCCQSIGYFVSSLGLELAILDIEGGEGRQTGIAERELYVLIEFLEKVKVGRLHYRSYLSL